jgi:cytochrome b561
MMKNTSTRFGLVAIVFHWLMAVMIFFLFGLGLYMVELNYYHEWYRTAPDLHKSIGITLLVLWCIRLLWRWTQIQPQTITGTTRWQLWERRLAAAMHVLLYLLIICICVTGYLISTADGRGIEVFSLLTLPALPLQLENQEDVAGEWHFYLAWALILMVCLHALAALKHHFIDKDDVLKKMFRPE